ICSTARTLWCWRGQKAERSTSTRSPFPDVTSCTGADRADLVGGPRLPAFRPMQRWSIVAALATVLLAGSACRAHPAASAPPHVELNANGGSVDIVGLPQQDLDHLRRGRASDDEWASLLRVTVARDAVS